MTTLIIGLDGLDGEYVQRTDLLSQLDPHVLEQDFEGANALYTYRVWNNIFAGELGGESDEPYDEYEPDGAYLWEKYPAEVLLAPVDNPSLTLENDAFPREYIESYAPGNRIEQTLDSLNDGVHDALQRGAPLVVACTRTPDILSHHCEHTAGNPDYWIAKVCGMVERWCRRADDFLLVSDHGFDYENWGASGINAHSRRATFASSFCDYETMTEFVANWHDDLATLQTERQMEALGYR